MPLFKNDGPIRDGKKQEEIGGDDSKQVDTRRVIYHPLKKQALELAVSMLAWPS